MQGKAVELVAFRSISFPITLILLPHPHDSHGDIEGDHQNNGGAVYQRQGAHSSPVLSGKTTGLVVGVVQR